MIKTPSTKVKKESLDMKLKSLEIKEKQLNIKGWKERELYDKDRGTNREIIDTLSFLLICSTIDEDKTIIGSEPTYKSVFDSEEKQVIKDKIFQLITNL